MRTALAPPKTTYRRDFRTENIMRLADVAAVNTERRAIEEAGAPPAWKSTRYDAVPSRVAEVIHAPPPPPEPTRVRAPKPVETGAPLAAVGQGVTPHSAPAVIWHAIYILVISACGALQSPPFQPSL